MDAKILKKLESIENALKSAATKDDLQQFATKDDLQKVKSDLVQKIDDTEVAIVARVDKFKADKVAIADLEKRVEKIEAELNN